MLSSANHCRSDTTSTVHGYPVCVISCKNMQETHFTLLWCQAGFANIEESDSGHWLHSHYGELGYTASVIITTFIVTISIFAIFKLTLLWTHYFIYILSVFTAITHTMLNFHLVSAIMFAFTWEVSISGCFKTGDHSCVQLDYI